MKRHGPTAKKPRAPRIPHEFADRSLRARLCGTVLLLAMVGSTDVGPAEEIHAEVGPAEESPGTGTGSAPEIGAREPAKPANAFEDDIRAIAALLPAESWPAMDEWRDRHAEDPTASWEALAARLHELPEREMLVAAALLLTRGERPLAERGQMALQELARTAKGRETRLEAIHLLREPVGSILDAAFLVLKGILDGKDAPEFRIAAFLSIWELENYAPHRQPILGLLNDPNVATRSDAALALAETGYLVPPVNTIVSHLRREPSERGRRAALVLELAEKRSSARDEERRTNGSSFPSRAAAVPSRGEAASADAPTAPVRTWSLMVEELIQLILDNTAERNRLRLRDLYVAALEGLVSSVDEYSAFQDPEEVRQAEAGRIGLQWGIGAQFVKPERAAPVCVARVTPGGPAHAAGLRTSDRIQQIQGVRTDQASMDEIRRLAAGAPGEEIHLLVEPWQGAAIRRISIRRGEVETPSTKSAMLPLGLGYIRLLRFGPKAAVEFEKALEALEAERLNALILDLRDNPGGRLEEAVRIVNLLVGERTEPIVTERGPTGTKEWYPSGDAKPFHPLFVLIDRGTTSAAEVVAGALQDYRRGVLIGQATYGKGAKQTAFRLPEALDDLLGGEGRLLLTTSYLYLPLGRSIQAEPTGTGPSGVAREGGVTPDIRCGEAEERPDERKLAEITRVQYSSAVGAYLRGCLPEIHSALAEGRSWEPSTGPDFDALLSSLSTNLSPQEVRRILRALARRHMEEERGRETIGSLDDDPALQRAVLEALKLLGRDPAEVPAYRSLPAEPGATNLRTEEKGRS